MIRVQNVIVDHSPGWGKWPDTLDMDYSDVLAIRWVEQVGDLEVTHRFLPAYQPWVDAGLQGSLVPAYPEIINDLAVPAPVAEAMLRRLEGVARDGCRSIHWFHARQCWPAVADRLRTLFPLRSLVYADDCPGLSERRTLNVLHGFNVALLAMGVFDFDLGTTSIAKYREFSPGIDVRFFALGASSGLNEIMQRAGMTVAEKVARYVSGEFPTDLVWLGRGTPAPGSRARHDLLWKLRRLAPQAPRWRMHGFGCPRDGILEPLGDVPTAVALYRDSMLGLNVPISSLFNTRLGDLFLTGTAQVIHDRHGELAARGIMPGEHFLPFDGTAEGLIAVVEEWRGRRADLAGVVVAAEKKFRSFADEFSLQSATSRVFQDYAERLA